MFRSKVLEREEAAENCNVKPTLLDEDTLRSDVFWTIKTLKSSFLCKTTDNLDVHFFEFDEIQNQSDNDNGIIKTLMNMINELSVVFPEYKGIYTLENKRVLLEPIQNKVKRGFLVKFDGEVFDFMSEDSLGQIDLLGFNEVCENELLAKDSPSVPFAVKVNEKDDSDG